MVSLFLLGLWVVYAPAFRHEIRPGATLAPLTIGNAKGDLEVVRPADPAVPPTFRILYRDGTTTPVIDAASLRALLGDTGYAQAIESSGNALFRIAKVTGWAGFFWVFVGFVGQMLFFGRMFVQWLVAEKEKKAVIPESFWWFSFFGGLMLFTYFAWRQDIVGVIGQTSGIVIYARNLRLIHKQKRRALRDAQA
ncbi:MAG: lipid-A-disaccharide synthase N-terminal domain-containing protein [Phycisphaerales bacterium]